MTTSFIEKNLWIEHNKFKKIYTVNQIARLAEVTSLIYHKKYLTIKNKSENIFFRSFLIILAFIDQKIAYGRSSEINGKI